MARAMPSLELLCLGPPSARVDGREPPPDVLWRKHTALLSYLALSPNGTRSRSHLLGLLWAESPEDKAACCVPRSAPNACSRTATCSS